MMNGECSVSFIRAQTLSKDDEDFATEFNTDDEDDIQITLAPYVQSYLAYRSKRFQICGITLPIPFERASRTSWWNPKYDSEILEGQYKRSAFPQLKYRFRYGLYYLLIVSICWFIYFLYCEMKYPNERLTNGGVIIQRVIIGVLIIIILCIVAFTYTATYTHHLTLTSAILAVILCTFSIYYVIFVPLPTSTTIGLKNWNLTKDSNRSIATLISPVGQMATCIEILLLIYTILPMPLYMCVCTSTVYSLFFEIFVNFLHRTNYKTSPLLAILVRAIIHLAVHLIGIHIFIMTNVRMRGTFMKVGQSLLVRRQLEMEKQLKEKMIHSVMPPKVADWLMAETGDFDFDEATGTGGGVLLGRNSNPGASDLKSLFRPFNMNTMENVSILFADIVGFTKMSSNKTAEGLVNILNDLFERFDHLCSINNCEKISTLGDCYYCVSGCPEPRPDHAICTVEMGLGMIDAIKQFDLERNEGVNMRVGIHTGTVLCGIVGTKRFKFDVWSNDVSLANKMESTGKPGRVHISQKTSDFLNNLYVLEEGEEVCDLKTYFIIGRQYEITQAQNNKKEFGSGVVPELKIVISDTSTPQISPIRHKLSLVYNRNELMPIFSRAKANSLPSVLDSNEEDDESKLNGSGTDATQRNLNATSPISIASFNSKYASRIKNWKVGKFLKKDENDKCTNGGYQAIAIENSIGGQKSNDSKTSTDSSNIIDVKSYISQSRQSDYERTSINSDFLRTGSYKSRYHGNNEHNDSELNRANSCNNNNSIRKQQSKRERKQLNELSPISRLRSQTVAARIETTNNKLESPHQCFDQLSINASVNSRKDSGIRSTSRRSSIQQQIFVINHSQMDIFNQHRVSGYYTSSQSTLNSHTCANNSCPPSISDQLVGQCFQKLRKQSDLQLIRCVQDNTSSKRSYFIEPPISPITLHFKTKQMENEYKNHIKITEKWNKDTIATLATPKYNTLFDVIVATIIYLLVSFSCFVLFNDLFLSRLIVFVAFLTVHLFVVYFSYKQVRSFSEKIFEYFSNHRVCLLFGALLISTPMLVLLTWFSCTNIDVKQNDYFFLYLSLLCVVHFSNFTQLTWWLKNLLATLFSFVILLFYFKTDCQVQNEFAYNLQICIDITLLLLLVWFLNREFEISYRLSFHSNSVAYRDKMRVQNMKNQADWLLHNIIPKHVADQLKNTAKYSENHKDVGIIFASIVNFNELYDESFMGGKEFLRVLNELIGDFDELLMRDEFKNVEKIKTIGSTFMAASGLNPHLRKLSQHSYEHLFDLMDFAIEMQKVIDNFNRDLIEFNLVLRVGYNFGDVTAGVIGTSKLYYDIWGDAVNIASRMDTTGVNEQIQIAGHCLDVLQERFEFEARGSVYVKGKDHMNVYLLVRKKDDCPPN